MLLHTLVASSFHYCVTFDRVEIPSILSTHSPVNRHLGYFRSLTIVNKATLSIQVHGFLYSYLSDK
jgi:hypothetical protein